MNIFLKLMSLTLVAVRYFLVFKPFINRIVCTICSHFAKNFIFFSKPRNKPKIKFLDHLFHGQVLLTNKNKIFLQHQSPLENGLWFSLYASNNQYLYYFIKVLWLPQRAKNFDFFYFPSRISAVLQGHRSNYFSVHLCLSEQIPNIFYQKVAFVCQIFYFTLSEAVVIPKLT